jgi:hypothetical protein
MTANSLQEFIEGMRSVWGPLTSELVTASRAHAARLLRASPDEPWLAELLRDRPASEELYRDPAHGFILLNHTETAGLYRPPHDHGRSWVIYAVQSGEMEMRTYARIGDPDTGVRLVQRDSTIVRAGEVQVYLPGDIHDTRCLTDQAMQYRFTERDLRVEDRQEHRLTRYQQRNGVWTAEAK